MRIACVCPTYKRPECLQNAAACFEHQTRKDDSFLLVMDDAQQFQAQRIGENIAVLSAAHRYPTLPLKWNALFQSAMGLWEPDVICVWEDDDVYLPKYLEQVASAIELGAHYVTWAKVWSTYQRPFGEAIVESAVGRFHASWSFRTSLLEEVGGWPQTEALIYDQRFGQSLATAAGPARHAVMQDAPQYVYRWGNGLYHGSQFGDGDDWYKKVGKLPLKTQWVGALIPKIDKETKKLIGWCHE